MRIDASPEALEVEPGRQAILSVAVYNDEPIIVAYRLRVLGLDPAWVTLSEERLSLFPDTSGVVMVTLDLPRDLPAGPRRIGIEATSLTEPAVTEVAEVEIDVPTSPEVTVELQPVSIFGTKTGRFGVVLTNDGNVPLRLALEADDAEEHLDVEFDPPRLEVGPGERVHVQAIASGRRPFVGTPVPHPFTVRATGTGAAVDPMAMGTLIQRPWLSRGALSLLGLLIAVTVFAGVLTATLGRVVDRSTARDELLLQVVRGETEGDVVTNPGAVAGTVTVLTSGAPVSGVTAEIFAADSPEEPLGSTATVEDGTFRFEELAEGAYKLRFRGAGFAEVWYPNALEPDRATDVEVAAGETTGGVAVRLGGIPGSIAGRVLGEDPGGSTVVLRVTADVIDGPVDAIVTSTVVDATGEFLLEDVPAPSTYELTVEKPGFASELRIVNIAAGEVVEDVEVSLFAGDGVISGRVSSAAGPVGGATITASSGATTVSTASLTQDAVGTFTLRNLPTPATYTLVITAPGYVTETFSIRLAQAQELSGLEVDLRGGTGSISGTVSISGAGPAGGVLVTVSDGDVVLSTRTVSVGAVGTYSIADVPLPGTYTVTFSREDLATQTRSVDLDSIGGGNATGINASLTRATATLTGQVTDAVSGPVGGVRVTLTSGDITRTGMSAHVPAGRYELRNLPPGTYTVTFERSGSQPRAMLVDLAPGQVRTLDVELEPQASISGTAGPGSIVRLYRLAAYPTTPLATVVADGSGDYTFAGLDAPENYIVEFTSGGGGTPIGTISVPLAAGEQRTGVNWP